MPFKTLIFVLILVSSAAAQPGSLLGVSILRSGFDVAKQATTSAGVNVVEAQHLQAARGEKVDSDKAWASFLDGSFLCGGVASSLGKLAVRGLAAAALGPLGGLATNFVGEALSSAGSTLWRGQQIETRDLLMRSAVVAAGGTVGAALIPIPVVGFAVGSIAANMVYEAWYARRPC